MPCTSLVTSRCSLIPGGNSSNSQDHTTGNFGEVHATVFISSNDVADGATTGLGIIRFTAVFSEAVTDFVETSDITVGGTATATVY